MIAKAGVCDAVKVTLCVHYNEAYPDELPDLTLKHEDPQITEQDVEDLLTDLRRVVSDCPPPPPWMLDSLACFPGRRKYWDGNDIHTCITSERKALYPRPIQNRRSKKNRSRNGTTGLRGMPRAIHPLSLLTSSKSGRGKANARYTCYSGVFQGVEGQIR